MMANKNILFGIGLAIIGIILCFTTVKTIGIILLVLGLGVVLLPKLKKGKKTETTEPQQDRTEEENIE